MKTGRPREPSAVKKLKGTYRADRARREPQPRIGAPRCPAWLAPAAKSEWKRIVKTLVRLGILSELDRAVLSAYVQAWARWQQAEQILEEHGLTFTTPNGYLQQRPEVSIAWAERKGMMQAAAELGLSPAARTRINAAPQSAPKTPMERLLEEVG